MGKRSSTKTLFQRRALGDDDVEQTIATSNPEGHVKEVQEKTIRSREEKEERMETESVQHLGDISDEVSSLLSLQRDILYFS